MSDRYLEGITAAHKRVAILTQYRQQLGLERVVIDSEAWKEHSAGYIGEINAAIDEQKSYIANCQNEADPYSCGWAETFYEEWDSAGLYRFHAFSKHELVRIPLDSAWSQRIVLQGSNPPIMIDSGSTATSFPPNAFPLDTEQAINDAWQGIGQMPQLTFLLGSAQFIVTHPRFRSDHSQFWSGVIVGQDVLTQTSWGVDWTRNAMIVTGDANEIVGNNPQWSAIPLTSHHESPPVFSLNVTINGVQSDFMIDSGHVGFVHFSRACFPDTDFTTWGGATVKSPMGEDNVELISLEEFSLTDASDLKFILKDKTVTASNGDPESILSKIKLCGLLGSEFLKQIDFLIDPALHIFYARMW